MAAELDRECEWLLANGVLPTGVVRRNRQAAEAALRPWTPAFIHGDLQLAHVFVDGANAAETRDAGATDAVVVHIEQREEQRRGARAFRGDSATSR